MVTRELLFSTTIKDCRVDTFRGTGKGGQKRNKTESAVRITHIASGAVGQSDDARSQHRNKQIAFRRMAESTKFKNWHKIEISRRSGQLADLNETIENLMQPSNLRVEGRLTGKWEEIE